MTKLEKDLFIKHAKRLQIIINDKSTFAKYLTRSDLNTTLRTELNVLCACEKLFPDAKLEAKYSSKELVAVFNKLTNSSFALNTEYKYEDESELIDSINYLFTFCNNMFKVNLDDLVAGKNVTATDPKIDLKAKPEVSDEGPTINPNFAFAAGGIPLASTPYENPYLIGKAYAKLNDDMKEGKFYRYKTQPKIIPIVKWISIILLMILAVALIITGVFAFISTNMEIADAEGTQATLGQAVNTISSGVINILVAAFCAYPIVITMRTLVGKHSKNLNLKYHFTWGYIAVTLALAFMIVMLDIRSTWLLPFDPISTTSTPYYAWLTWKIFFIVDCAIVGVSLVPIILATIFNPKPDPEIVEKKIKEYIDMFSSESGTNPVPPRADVQKPTDVKDSTESKDSNKK